jgi:hypothetical protein
MCDNVKIDFINDKDLVKNENGVPLVDIINLIKERDGEILGEEKHEETDSLIKKCDSLIEKWNSLGPKQFNTIVSFIAELKKNNKSPKPTTEQIKPEPTATGPIKPEQIKPEQIKLEPTTTEPIKPETTVIGPTTPERPTTTEPVKTLHDYLITLPEIISYVFDRNDDLKKIHDVSNFQPILTKINDFHNFLKTNNELDEKIDSTKYKNIFAMSDIHADLHKFKQNLADNGIINSQNELMLLDSLVNIEWIAPDNSLLVIIGDIIDGRRYEEKEKEKIKTIFWFNVNDEIGNIEVLLHIYIHNLRIKAKEKNSEVLFTFGNHDIGSLIGLYDVYVTKYAKDFFSGEIEIRKTTLLPFYKNSPYIFLDIFKSEHIIRFLHAGLPYGGEVADEKLQSLVLDKKDLPGEKQIEVNGHSKTYKFFNIQKELISNFDWGFDLLTKYMLKYSDTDSEETVNIFTNKTYYDPKSLCVSKKLLKLPYLMIIGHCITHNVVKEAEFHKIFVGNKDTYSHCSAHGCVALGCIEKIGSEIKPKLIYVDTGSSQCFRLPKKDWDKFTNELHIDTQLIEENNKRKNEILHIFMTDDSYKVVKPAKISAFLYPPNGFNPNPTGGKSKKNNMSKKRLKKIKTQKNKNLPTKQKSTIKTKSKQNKNPRTKIPNKIQTKQNPKKTKIH